jgi:hypothetical protein
VVAQAAAADFETPEETRTMSRKQSTAEETLQRWADEQAAEDRDQSKRDRFRFRAMELERAFLAVRGGLPDTGDDRADAFAFAKQLGRVGRVVQDNPCLVHCLPNQIEAEVDSPKAYALTVLAEAATGHVAEAAGMLLNSWHASKPKHCEVLYWLTGGLEAILRGRDKPAAQATAGDAPLSPLPPLPPAEGTDRRDAAGTLAAPGGNRPVSSTTPAAPQKPPPADGPLDDDCVAWAGASYRIPHLQWLLLKTLWNKPQGVRTGRVLQAVYGQDDGEARLKALAHDLKVTLKKHQIPYLPSCHSERWRLVARDTSHHA